MTARRAIGGHHSSRMLSDTWLTPRFILDALGDFDLDPCAAPEPRPWSTAARHIGRPDDGLAARWQGRVWLNPPYSREAVRWIAKLADHGTGTALIFARTETAWFVEQVWKRATALLFLHGRIRFILPTGQPYHDNAGAPSVLVAYGQDDAEALYESGLNGTYVPAWRPAAMAADYLGQPLAGMPAAHRKALDAVQWPEVARQVVAPYGTHAHGHTDDAHLARGGGLR